MLKFAKHMPINGTIIKAEFNNLFSTIKTRRTVAFSMFAFLGFTIFLAFFNPSSNSNSLWFPTSSDSYKSQFSSLFDYLFPNNSSSSSSSSSNDSFNKSDSINKTQTPFLSANPPSSSNNPRVPKASDETRVVDENAAVLANQSNETGSEKNGKKQGIDELVDSLMNCDLFDGKWVKDESYPLYKPGSCSFIDHQFSCYANGRRDQDYLKWKWKPKACTLPRMNGEHLLEILKGKRLVFVGDSLNRNMWESLVCILQGAAKNPKNVHEANGRHYFRGEPSYSVIFNDYNCTIEFYVSPFLVREWRMPDENGTTKDTLRLDLVGRSSDKYKSADILVFNTGHWWNHEKTSKGKDYYQEGDHVYDELNVLDAFRKALTTWAKWVDANVNPSKTMVFFRGYSAVHFRGGEWNSGGICDAETKPIRNETLLRPYLPKMLVLESVLKGMKTHVTYLNITRLTDFRKDGHPSVYRKYRKVPMSKKERAKTIQDCSHWCLPGVPDAWNEILYSELLVKENKMKQHQEKFG